ncbi:MAG: iron chaperone [Opitutales bacterium]
MPHDITSYLEDQTPEVQRLLKQLRATILAAAPGATETIKYGIPTYVLLGRNLVHFGGFARHVSFFPTSSPIRKFKAELKGYTTAKGTVQFPLGQRLPLALIRRMVKFRVAEVSRKP